MIFDNRIKTKNFSLQKYCQFFLFAQYIFGIQFDKMFLNIFLAFLLILIVYIYFSIRDYFGHDLFKDFSENSVPLMKNSFNVVRLNPGEKIFTNQSSAFNNQFKILSVELFQFARDCAKVFKKSHRVKFFGRHVYSVIKVGFNLN